MNRSDQILAHEEHGHNPQSCILQKQRTLWEAESAVVWNNYGQGNLVTVLGGYRNPWNREGMRLCMSSLNYMRYELKGFKELPGFKAVFLQSRELLILEMYFELGPQ